ncbi:hypothetical protein H4O18_06160 [Arenibacter sp. BSSL-BM3]|uniref:Uncharacterized protein n=1 Tax=Arenibacter arenosicollis TaxID=2762274 RepID=A0ABR7QK57_9FLAO|nr:hypothetical protein [Arenibacter arenosicollis]MBC8767571.1 hypothetical protein [Arenibacter arenosicollis]
MKNKILLLSFILLALYSCIETQNFDQYDDLEIIPTVEASILYVESPERIINESVGQYFYSQDFNFDAFTFDAFADRVLDGSIFFEIDNTTSKEFKPTVEFLDEDGNTIDTIDFPVQPSAPTPLYRRQVPYGPGKQRSIEIIKNTSSIKVSVLIEDNSSVSNLPDPKIIFRSSGKFRVRLK